MDIIHILGENLQGHKLNILINMLSFVKKCDACIFSCHLYNIITVIIIDNNLLLDLIFGFVQEKRRNNLVNIRKNLVYV